MTENLVIDALVTQYSDSSSSLIQNARLKNPAELFKPKLLSFYVALIFLGFCFQALSSGFSLRV